VHPEVQPALTGATSRPATGWPRPPAPSAAASPPRAALAPAHPPEREPPADPELSLVLPCLDEEGSLAALTDELYAALTPLGRRFEILFVDDGSTDRTLELLRGIRARRPEVVVLRHARTCGESAAFATGFARARAPIVITMDGDRQHDPAEIPALLEALAGADLVCGVRRRRADGWVRRVSSRVGKGCLTAYTGGGLPDAGCTYRAVRRAALAELPVFNGMHRFLPTLLTLQGWVVREVPVSHRPRTAGRSKYGIANRLVRGLVDCLVMRWFRRRVIAAARTVEDAPPARARR
jgi:glycosyltransferase involved in cell wall biosynthesis